MIRWRIGAEQYLLVTTSVRYKGGFTKLTEEGQLQRDVL